MVKMLRFSKRLTGSIAVFLSVLVPTTLYGPYALAAGSSRPGIHIDVLNIRNSTGKVDCALFESPTGFPYEALRSAKILMALKIQDTKAACDFEDIPPGTYAIAVIHDENVNGKLDTNKFGKPKEGYGFSSGAKASLSAPTFSDASFQYQGGALNLTITLKY